MTRLKKNKGDLIEHECNDVSPTFARQHVYVGENGTTTPVMCLDMLLVLNLVYDHSLNKTDISVHYHYSGHTVGMCVFLRCKKYVNDVAYFCTVFA